MEEWTWTWYGQKCTNWFVDAVFSLAEHSFGSVRVQKIHRVHCAVVGAFLPPPSIVPPVNDGRQGNSWNGVCGRGMQKRNSKSRLLKSESNFN
jgi:hypothetical protein